MAHFAQLQGEAPNQTVSQVIVVSNDVIGNVTGLDGEAIGIAFCKLLFGVETNWIQTSYNSKFRGRFAGAGMTYDPIKDEFAAPTPVK